MKQMGFGEKWCAWIKGCLCSASASVLVNGSPTKEFRMERGLRQGDHLSPFLLLIVAEALQVTLLETFNKRFYKGLYLNEEGSNLSLLQYADDALFFGDWSMMNAKVLIRILKCFQNASGLRVNFVKSKFYGIGLNLDQVAKVAASINCGYGSLPFIYLGLLIGKHMNKVNGWNDVVDCLHIRLSRKRFLVASLFTVYLFSVPPLES